MLGNRQRRGVSTTVVAGTVLVLAGACAGGLSHGSPEARSTDGEPGESTSGSGEIRSTEDPADVLGDPLPEPSPTDSEVEVPFNFRDWCAERELSVELDVERCRPAGLGDRPEDTLWCYRREELDEDRVIYWQALYVAQGRKLRRLVELPYSTGPQSGTSSNATERRYVTLTTSAAEDGSTFELKDDRAPDCAEALRRNRAEHPYEPAQAEPVDAVIERVCAARGRYHWQGRRAK